MAEVVTLTNSEIMIGAQLGVMRQIQNVKQKRHARYGAGEDRSWHLHIEGALGEMAVAKYLGWYWSGALGDLEAGDVASAILNKEVEVRTTHHDNGRLIIHEGDSDDAAFVLMIGRLGTYRLMGWMWGYEAKKERYWEDPSGNGRPAFFVDAEHLIGMRDLLVALSLRA